MSISVCRTKCENLCACQFIDLFFWPNPQKFIRSKEVMLMRARKPLMASVRKIRQHTTEVSEMWCIPEKKYPNINPTKFGVVPNAVKTTKMLCLLSGNFFQPVFKCSVYADGHLLIFLSETYHHIVAGCVVNQNQNSSIDSSIFLESFPMIRSSINRNILSMPITDSFSTQVVQLPSRAKKDW